MKTYSFYGMIKKKTRKVFANMSMGYANIIDING